jgi:multidrug efflux pump subunit AcrA (membrane-fusion protein)
MKKIFWTTFLMLSVTLTACSNEITSAPSPAVPATVSAPTGLTLTGGVVASAKAVPAQDVQMSFVISAPVQEVPVWEGKMVSAGQTLMKLYSPELEFSVYAAEFALTSADIEYQYWIPRKDRPPERRDQAKAIFERTKARLETANAAFAQASLIAPFDGTVVDIKVQPGEFAQAGQVVIVLGDVAHMQIRTTDLSERDVVDVKVGQSVNVHIEALDIIVTGKVAQISLIAESVGGDVVYPVTIDLDEQPEGLLWGMTAEVEIQTQ